MTDRGTRLLFFLSLALFHPRHTFFSPFLENVAKEV